MKFNKFLIIFIFLITLLLMSVGYSSFATDLDVQGMAEITGTWNIKITKVETTFISPEVTEITPTFTDNTVNLNVKLNKPGDKVIYTITIKNTGTIDATLQGLIFNDEVDGSEAISYTVSKIPEDLNAGDETTIEITITYNDNVTEMPLVKTKTLTGTIAYVQK